MGMGYLGTAKYLRRDLEPDDVMMERDLANKALRIRLHKGVDEEVTREEMRAVCFKK